MPAPPSSSTASGSASGNAPAQVLPPAVSTSEPPRNGRDAGLSAPEPKCIQSTLSAPVRTISTPVPDPRCPADPDRFAPTLSVGKVIFSDAKAALASVEIAKSESDEERGLMYRRSMPPDSGMLFLFPDAVDHRFWMHDTCIPLDMVFIDGVTIVGIEENCQTMDDSTYDVGCPSTAVIELNAGWTRAHGVKAGQHVSFEGVQ
jgi:uncharacterized membrane protein (UPF0127 family)